MARVNVTDEQIAREFRLQRCRGSAMQAISNPAVRAALELGARVRAAREGQAPVVSNPDPKRRAANDHNEEQ